MPNRVANFNLGVNLGWLQQGATFGGRSVPEMTADLQRIRATADLLGYTGLAPLVAGGVSALGTSQSPGHAADVAQSLVVLLQNQASGTDSAALNLGIVLGWLQQGARADNRSVSLATSDLNSARTHAANAGYTAYDGYVANALTKLTSGLPVSSVLVEATALIGLFQGEG